MLWVTIILILISGLCLICAWNKDIPLGERIAFTLLTVSSFISTFSSFRANPFTIDDEVGFIGIIVAIMGIPLAILLGWNIYKILDFNKIKDEQKKFQADSIKKINEMEVSLNKKIEKGIIESHKSMVLLYNSKSEEMNEDDEFFILFHYLSILVHQSKIGMIEDCNRTIDAILFTVGNIQVPLYRNDAIQNLLGEIENKNMISKWKDLAGFITNHIKVTPIGNTNQNGLVKPNKKQKKRKPKK